MRMQSPEVERGLCRSIGSGGLGGRACAASRLSAPASRISEMALECSTDQATTSHKNRSLFLIFGDQWSMSNVSPNLSLSGLRFFAAGDQTETAMNIIIGNREA